MATSASPSSKFSIPDEVQSKYPDLVKLVLNTESMDDNEKQYWFDILPSMNNEQVDRLFTILDTERIKLEELEARAKEEILALNGRQKIEWQEFQARKIEDVDAHISEGLRIHKELISK